MTGQPGWHHHNTTQILTGVRTNDRHIVSHCSDLSCIDIAIDIAVCLLQCNNIELQCSLFSEYYCIHCLLSQCVGHRPMATEVTQLTCLLAQTISVINQDSKVITGGWHVTVSNRHYLYTCV